MNAPDWYHPIDSTDLLNLRRFPVEWRWVFIEVFTGDTASKLGLADVRPANVAEESGIDRATVDMAIAGLTLARMMVYDPQTRRAYHRGHLLRQGPGPKSTHYAGWVKLLDSMPECLAAKAARMEIDRIPCASDSLSIAYPEPIDSSSTRNVTGTGTGTGTTTETETSSPPSATPGATAPDLFPAQSSNEKDKKPKAEKKAKPEVSEATRKARDVIALWNEMIEDGELHHAIAKEDARKNNVIAKAIDTAGGTWALIDLLDWAGTTRAWGGNENYVSDIYQWMADVNLRKCLAAFRNANGRDPDPRKPEDEPEEVAPPAAPLRIVAAPIGCPKCGSVRNELAGYGEARTCECGYYWTPSEAAA